MCGAASLISSCSGADKAQLDKPNVLLIYVDDMGYGDMSCQNPDSKIQTPNIDALASEGIRFTDGHSSASTSSPSRYAMLTGNYHWRRTHDIVHAFGESLFEEGELTLPEMLQQSGYRTALVGKWHLGWDWDGITTDEAKERRANAEASGEKVVINKPTDFDWSGDFNGGPCDWGFDYYFGDGTVNFPPYCWIENERVTQTPTIMARDLKYKPLEERVGLRPGPAVEGWKVEDVLPTLADKMVEVVSQQSEEQPFFVMCSFSAPHFPIHPSEEFHGTSQAGFYGDFVVQCDHIVGRILDALDQTGLSDNTIVIFTSDNGPEQVAYGRLDKFEHSSIGSLRGVKRDVWEGGHRVPFIIRWPGVTQEGVVSDEVVSQVDFMATLAEVVGYELPNDAAHDSYSLMPLLKGDSIDGTLREATVQNSEPFNFTIRKGDWVLIDNYTGSVSTPVESYLDRYGYSEYSAEDGDRALLYNLREDLSQHNNLSQEYPEKVAELQALLKRYRDEGRSIPQRD